jgi:trehalose synthase-fused probable maltokinase
MTTTELLARYGLRDHAADRLAAFAAVQRWFAERDAVVAATAVDDAGVLGEEMDCTVLFTVLSVDYDGGAHDRYQLPVGVLGGTAQDIADPTSVIAEGMRDGSPVVFVDALANARCASVLWKVMAEERMVTTIRGELRGRGEAVQVNGDLAQQLRPLGREQSNTSLVRADSELLKCFRHLEDGPTPELEMTQTLSAAGFTAVPAPLGVIEYRRDGLDTSLVALLQPFFHNGTEGWALALTSLRDLYAAAEETDAGDAEAIRAAIDGQGSTFLPEATRLGETTAEMHLALSSDRLPETMRPQPVDHDILRRWSAEMTADLDRLLERRSPALDPLRAVRSSVAGCFDAIEALDEGGLAIRLHGDYHLGQVLRTDAGWTVLDFEGEPTRDLSERRLRSSPLRDVAGMMRSLDYATSVALMERLTPNDPDWERLRAHGDAWAAANRRLFWGAYLARIGTSPLLPDAAATTALRRAFEMQKAVYEADYELGHRPDWVAIPLRFLLREAGQ